MIKIDVVNIIDENYKEAHKLLWENCKSKEVALRKKVFAIIGISEGNITKVRMTDKDTCMEVYFEDNENIDNGWADVCDISYGYENNVYLEIGNMFAK